MAAIANVPTDHLSFSTDLAFPGLYPQAIQFALFDHDPTTEFQSFLAERGWHTRSADEDSVARNAHLMAAWDQLFQGVVGCDMFLTAPKDVPRTMTDPSTDKEMVQMTKTGVYLSYDKPVPAETRWIVTKAHSHGARSIAWCLRVELKQGSHPTIELTPDNSLDLEQTAQ